MAKSVLWVFIIALKIRPALFCAGGGTANNQIFTNPSFNLQFNPPAAWTYPTDSAQTTSSFFPGQPLTQTEATNNANGAMQAAMLQALSEAAINTAPITVTVAYTAPQVSDCVKIASGTVTMTMIGQTIGIEEAGAIIQLATPGVAIAVAMCAAHDFSTSMMTFTPFIQQASIKVEGLTASGFQMQQIANSLMAILNFNNRALFTQQITYS